MTSKRRGGPPRKKFLKTATIERRGVALCASIVLEMGHIWREKGVDVGVDGEIELVDSEDALGRVLWVQSKAQSDRNPFPGETDGGFSYTCRQVDLDYWMGGTAPVILVCSHPESGLAWFKDLRSWFAEPSRRRSRRVDFEKAADRFDAAAARKLLNLGLDASSGIYLTPAPRHETLTTNLLAVDHVPATVHHAPSTCRGWADANPRLVKAQAGQVSDVVFHGERVWSFRRFDEAPLSALADGGSESMASEELAVSPDTADENLLRWIMSATLKDLLYQDLAQHPDDRSVYYFKPKPGQLERTIKVGHRRGGGRSVVRRYEPPDGATWSPYCRHMAAELRFVRGAGRWFLSIEPTYYFSSDGRTEFAFAAQQLAKIKQIDRHDAVRSQTVFWARYLAGDGLFGHGSDRRLRFGALVTSDVERGIDDRSWKPLNPEEITLISHDGAPTLFDDLDGADA